MKALIPCVMLLFAGIGLAQPGDDKSDLDRMQGIWEITSLVEKGERATKAELEAVFVVIEKDTFTTIDKTEIRISFFKDWFLPAFDGVQYRIKLDPTKKPKAIDFTHILDKEKEQTEPGIYAFANDVLKLVLDEDKKGRPTVFEGKETASYSVMVLKKKAKN
jgi:uncharacterized protein (TIGR03067 family)